MVSSLRPALARGAFRDRHERGAWDAVGALDCSVSHLMPTDNLVRTVKSCGPGIPVLVPAQRLGVVAKTGAIKPVPGESTYKP
jgi:hypothetical protein